MDEFLFSDVVYTQCILYIVIFVYCAWNNKYCKGVSSESVTSVNLSPF